MLLERLMPAQRPRCAALAQRVYCTALALLLILSEVFSSSIQNTLPAFSHGWRLALTGGAILLLLAKCLLLTDYDSPRQWFVLAAALGYAGFAAWYGGDQWFFLAALLGVAAKGVDLRQALRVYLAVAAAGLVLVQLLHYTTALVPFNYYCRNWDFGYGHYNGYGARLLGIFFAWGWLRWPRLRWFDWAGLAALAVYTAVVPGSRGAVGAMALLLALFALYRLRPALFRGRWWAAPVMALYPLLTGASLLASRFFDPADPAATPLLNRLNGLLSGRFEVWNHMLFHTTLLHEDWTELCSAGWMHWSLLGGFATDGDVHHAIDNMYLALLMNKGVVGAVVVGAVFLVLLWRLCRGRHLGELFGLTALLFYLIMENKPFLLAANPFVLLLPCALLTPRGQPLPVASPVPDGE